MRPVTAMIPALHVLPACKWGPVGLRLLETWIEEELAIHAYFANMPMPCGYPTPPHYPTPPRPEPDGTVSTAVLRVCWPL